MSHATISKEFHFSASHQLDGLAEDHPCSRLHGHNYIFRLELTGDTDAVGFVYDYRRLDWFKAMVDERLDHRHLNDVLHFNPTAEHMAAWAARLVAERLDHERADNVHRVAVSVSETPKTWATAQAFLRQQDRNLHEPTTRGYAR